MKDPEKVKQGKRNRRMGADFERRTRKDLEQKGWFVSKYQNNVEFLYNLSILNSQGPVKEGKMIPAKASRFRLSSTGFPDFISYKKVKFKNENIYYVDFIECKVNGRLSKVEKEKAQWYLDNNVCSKFLIAYKEKINNRVKVKYKEFERK